MIKENKQYNNIDLFKFIFAIVVVMIHTTPFMDISETFSWVFNNTFCNIAVPFFFVASGFLFFDKLDGVKENETKRLRRYVGHILKMYITWCIIWIPWKVLSFIQTGFTLSTLLGYIKDIVLVSGGDALWYLPALIVSITATYLMYTRLQSPKVIVAISTIPYVIGIAITSWHGLFDNNAVTEWFYKIFESADNGLMYGVMFISIGMYHAKVKPQINKLKDIILCVIFFGILVAEAFIIDKMGYNRGGECNLLTLPFVIWYFFKIVLSIDLKDNKIYGRLRDYSTLIYLSHCFIIRALKMVFAIGNINISYIVLFVLTFILALMFANIVRYFAKEKNLKFFKLLY